MIESVLLGEMNRATSLTVGWVKTRVDGNPVLSTSFSEVIARVTMIDESPADMRGVSANTTSPSVSDTIDDTSYHPTCRIASSFACMWHSISLIFVPTASSA